MMSLWIFTADSVLVYVLVPARCVRLQLRALKQRIIYTLDYSTLTYPHDRIYKGNAAVKRLCQSEMYVVRYMGVCLNI